jgi:hypothetical protein
VVKYLPINGFIVDPTGGSGICMACLQVTEACTRIWIA